jgi:hypothetical protein
MPDIDMTLVAAFINQNIDSFHENRIAKIQELQLREVLKRKNPYLFRAKNIETGQQLLTALVDAFVSSSEETLFGGFLESVAIYACHLVYGGQKSSSTGIDLDFTRDSVRYLVTIKSSPSWGNSSQYQALEANFKNALKVLRQSSHVGATQAVLGMCFGKMRDSDTGVYLKKHGQSFWTFISGSPRLYLDIVEPLGYEALERNARYETEKQATIKRLAQQFVPEFCDAGGYIEWSKLVKFNSGNLRESDFT